MSTAHPHNLNLARAVGLYLKERFPAPVALIYATLFASSITSFFYPRRRITELLALKPTVLITATVFLFLLRLRLFDEIKDQAYDSLHHPERPIPKGVLDIGLIGRFALAVLSVEVGIQFFNPAGPLLSYGIFLSYSALMYREFFMRDFLACNMALMLILHQLIFIPLTLYAASVAHGSFFIPRTNAELLLFPISLIPPLIFELGRKLEHRRDARGVATDDTYAYRWGASRTFLIIVIAALVHIASLFLISQQYLLLAPYITGLLAVVVAYVRNASLVIKTAKVWSMVLALFGMVVFLVSNL
jgi:hypothetical protein